MPDATEDPLPEESALIARSQALREKAEKILAEMEHVEKLIAKVKKAKTEAQPRMAP